jgi:ParB/RepB/Spo0J family partition protein
MNTHSQTLEAVAIRDLRASKTNPRKNFAPVALQELADSIRTQGIRQPILARPKAGETPYEIVAGERRYRAAILAGLDAVPCLVQEMNDREALEVQVVENLQRSDLTEMEEAQSYQSMLELKDETTGAAVYTAELLAERFGKERSHVYRRLVLLRLIDSGRDALAAGQLGGRSAVLVARIPSPEAQAEALKQILTPQHRQEPLTFVETRELISRDYLQGLKGAPFKLEDAALVPAAGPCATCPKMSDNCAHLFSAEEAEQVKKKKVCTDPACYRLKLDALWAKRTEKAAAEGKTVLDEKESREIFPPYVEPGVMAYSSHYMLLGDKPAAYLLKPEVVENVGSWRSLIEEAEKKSAAIALTAAKDAVREDATLSAAAKKDALALIDKNPPGGSVLPRILARDQSGAARELVDRGLAMTLIEAAGDPIFMGKTNANPGGVSQFDKERKAQVEAAKLRLAESIEAITRIHGELVAIWQPSPVWEGLFEVAMGHAGHDGVWLIAKWQGLKYQNEGTNLYDVVGAWAAGLPAEDRQALVPIMLMGQHLKNSGPGEELETFAQACEIPCELNDIARAAKLALKANKTEKKPKELKAPKKTKAEKKAEEDAQRALEWEWNENGVATKPDIEETIDDMPQGTKCEVQLARAPDGFWRFGLNLQSRTEGKAGQSALPSLAGEKFADCDDAMMAGFHAALPFFKDDPAAFRVVARDCDADVVDAIEDEGEAAPVAGKATKAKRTKITAEVECMVAGLHTEGKSDQEIAKQLGLSIASVWNIKKTMGIIQPTTEAGPAAEEPAAVPVEVDIASARETLLAALKEAIPGLSDQARDKILAKYAKRVGSEKTALEDLSYAEVMKILDILATAKVGRVAGKAKVSTAGEQE